MPTGTMGCSDFNPCTTDACVPGGGCDFSPREDGAECGLGSDCSMSQCSGGICVGGSGCPGSQMCCPGYGCIPNGAICGVS